MPRIATLFAMTLVVVAACSHTAGPEDPPPAAVETPRAPSALLADYDPPIFDLRVARAAPAVGQDDSISYAVSWEPVEDTEDYTVGGYLVRVFANSAVDEPLIEREYEPGAERDVFTLPSRFGVYWFRGGWWQESAYDGVSVLQRNHRRFPVNARPYDEAVEVTTCTPDISGFGAQQNGQDEVYLSWSRISVSSACAQPERVYIQIDFAYSPAVYDTVDSKQLLRSAGSIIASPGDTEAVHSVMSHTVGTTRHAVPNPLEAITYEAYTVEPLSVADSIGGTDDESANQGRKSSASVTWDATATKTVTPPPPSLGYAVLSGASLFVEVFSPTPDYDYEGRYRECLDLQYEGSGTNRGRVCRRWASWRGAGTATEADTTRTGPHSNSNVTHVYSLSATVSNGFAWHEMEIRAVASGSRSGYTSTGLIPGHQRPGAPQIRDAVTDTLGNVTLRWLLVAHATGYEVTSNRGLREMTTARSFTTAHTATTRYTITSIGHGFTGGSSSITVSAEEDNTTVGPPTEVGGTFGNPAPPASCVNHARHADRNSGSGAHQFQREDGTMVFYCARPDSPIMGGITESGSTVSVTWITSGSSTGNSGAGNYTYNPGTTRTGDAATISSVTADGTAKPVKWDNIGGGTVPDTTRTAVDFTGTSYTATGSGWWEVTFYAHATNSAGLGSWAEWNCESDSGKCRDGSRSKIRAYVRR